MSAFYDEMAATAKALIDEFGTNVILSLKIDGVHDLVKGWIVKPTIEEHATRGVRSKWTQEELRDTSILTTDMKIVIDASVKPVKGYTVTIGGVNAGKIVEIFTAKPADVAIVYILQTRV